MNEKRRRYTIEEIRNAPEAGVEELEEAVFPCYGVKIYYKEGQRTIEEFYPEGMDEPDIPWLK